MNEFDDIIKRIKPKKREKFVSCLDCEQYAGVKNGKCKRGKKDIWHCKIGFPNCPHRCQVIS